MGLFVSYKECGRGVNSHDCFCLPIEYEVKTTFIFQFNSNDDTSDTDDDDDVDAQPKKRRRNTETSAPKPKPPILGPDPTIPADTSRRRQRRPRTVFHKAIDALQMDWDDIQLKNILKNVGVTSRLTSVEDNAEASALATTTSKVNKHGQLLWQEHIPTACARVEALRTHGYTAEALRLAVAIVRTMKHNQVRMITREKERKRD